MRQADCVQAAHIRVQGVGLCLIEGAEQIAALLKGNRVSSAFA